MNYELSATAVSELGPKLGFLFILLGSRISEFPKSYYPDIGDVNTNLIDLQIQQQYNI